MCLKAYRKEEKLSSMVSRKESQAYSLNPTKMLRNKELSDFSRAQQKE